MILITGMRVGGAERVAATMANTFNRRGHDSTLVSMQNKPNPYPLDEQVHYFGCGLSYNEEGGSLAKNASLIRSAIKAFPRFRRIIKENRPDAVITFLNNASIFGVLYKILRDHHLPVIVYEQSDPRRYSKAMCKILRFFFKHSNAVVCQSRDVENYYREGGSKKTVVIDNPLNEDCIAIEPATVRSKRIVAAGRLMKLKNYNLLLDAFEKVHTLFPEYQLEIYGDGPDKEILEQKRDKMTCASYVHFMGNVSNVMRRVSDASLYVMSSDYEGFPNALVEAMASGIPAICTDYPSGTAREIIQSGVNGIVVPTGDVDAMADAMKTMLGDRNKAEAMGKEGYKIRERLEANHISEQWESLVREVSGR